ncbi:MAG: rod shape-determining protein RodA [Alphaproteobacteria bacterium]
MPYVYSRDLGLKGPEMTIKEKLFHISWLFVLSITLVASVGFIMLYSAAKGNLDPWADRQIARFGIGFIIMLLFAMIDIRKWLKYSGFIYLMSLILLVVVEIEGSIGMGAQRWINFGFFYIQPSEIMKIALILYLAKYFHGSTLQEIEQTRHLMYPIFLILLPVALVMKQPDLGTAMLLLMGGSSILFLVGVQSWKFLVAGGVGLSLIPIAWQFLREYQKQRVLTFLDPTRDPLGSGYHIIQSQIAIGSGGVFGKGFLKGTQSHLDFLPEKQTDFIFTMLAEEFGMIGCITLIALYLVIITYGYLIAFRSQNFFGKILGIGITTNFFLYFFINIAMVIGLVPVVGVPLPLISYGGTAMMTLMAGFGLVLCVHVHKDIQIGKRGSSEDFF